MTELFFPSNIKKTPFQGSNVMKIPLQVRSMYIKFQLNSYFLTLLNFQRTSLREREKETLKSNFLEKKEKRNRSHQLETENSFNAAGRVEMCSQISLNFQFSTLNRFSLSLRRQEDEYTQEEQALITPAQA